MKKLISILVLSLIYSGSVLANIFYVECVTNETKVFDANRKNVYNGFKVNPVIFTFDEKKQKNTEVDFKQANTHVLITDSSINWHIFFFNDDKRKESLKSIFNVSDAAIDIRVFEINRYTGEYRNDIYALNSFWTNKYLGLTPENMNTYNFDITYTRKFFLSSAEILKKAIKENSYNNPQKDFIHTSSLKGVCNKTNKRQKF